MFLQHCLSNSSNVHLIDDGSYHFNEDYWAHFLSMPLRSRWPMMWCPWSVPTSSVSRPSTLQILQDASQMWWLLCLLNHICSLPLLHIRTVKDTITKILSLVHIHVKYVLHKLSKSMNIERYLLSLSLTHTHTQTHISINNSVKYNIFSFFEHALMS